MTRQTSATGGARAHPNLTLGLLAVAAVSYVLQQTLVVPALPTIQRDLGTTTTWATWVFTGFLLASAISTPLVGKLGDMHGKKRMLVMALVVFAAGTVAAALADSIALLIAARALQGVGGAVFPLTFGIVRDELPADRIGMGLGLLSATFGVGGGAGLVLSGVILQDLHWSWLFWIGAVPVVAAAALVAVFVPESPVRTPARLDGKGALALSAGLGALLLALSEGERWGWTSAATIGTFGAALAILVLWVAIELRVAEPMIDIAMMRDRSVFWTNVAALLAGFAMFGTFLLVPTLVQMPRGLPAPLASAVDYGFGASVIVAGLYLLPASAVMLVVGPLTGFAERRLGARALVLWGFVVLGLGGVALALLHDSGAGIVVSMTLVGIGVGLAYAMLAKLVVDAVSPAVTGVAMGMNTVMRTVGGVVGGQVGAAILSALTIPQVPGVPEESAFTITFLVSAGIAALAALGTLRIPRRPGGRPAPAAPPEAVVLAASSSER